MKNKKKIILGLAFFALAHASSCMANDDDQKPESNQETVEVNSNVQNQNLPQQQQEENLENSQRQEDQNLLRSQSQNSNSRSDLVENPFQDVSPEVGSSTSHQVVQEDTIQQQQQGGSFNETEFEQENFQSKLKDSIAKLKNVFERIEGRIKEIITEEDIEDRNESINKIETLDAQNSIGSIQTLQMNLPPLLETTLSLYDFVNDLAYTMLKKVVPVLEGLEAEKANQADLDALKKNMVTKADLDALKQDMVTKADLNALKQDMVTKAQELEQDMVTKAQVAQMVQEELEKRRQGFDPQLNEEELLNLDDNLVNNSTVLENKETQQQNQDLDLNSNGHSSNLFNKTEVPNTSTDNINSGQMKTNELESSNQLKDNLKKKQEEQIDLTQEKKNALTNPRDLQEEIDPQDNESFEKLDSDSEKSQKAPSESSSVQGEIQNIMNQKMSQKVDYNNQQDDQGLDDFERRLTRAQSLNMNDLANGEGLDNLALQRSQSQNIPEKKDDPFTTKIRNTLVTKANSYASNSNEQNALLALTNNEEFRNFINKEVLEAYKNWRVVEKKKGTYPKWLSGRSENNASKKVLEAQTFYTKNIQGKNNQSDVNTAVNDAIEEVFPELKKASEELKLKKASEELKNKK